MDVSLKVTDQPQESCFFDLVSGDNVLAIPLFQRPYRWSQKNVDWLLEDIEEIRTGVARSCFLGVVVCVPRGAFPGRPIPWEIVDGQQRLTTLYLLLMAATDTAARKGHATWAAGVVGTYLLVRPMAENPVNTKLIPSAADRTQFKDIWDSIMSIEALASDPAIAANRPKPPAPSGLPTGAMQAQFGRLRRKFQRIYEQQGLDALTRIVDVAASNLSVVSISLRDPLVAPKIFERLNNRAEMVTPADLVRNEVFSQVSQDVGTATNIFNNYWEPFSERLRPISGGLEKFLFPYGLVINRAVTKADLFNNIRSYWATLSGPAAIISDMTRYLDAFLALETGVTTATIPPGIALRLNRIHRLGKPSSTYSFILRLVVAVNEQEVSEQNASDTLDVIESFLFRRAITGIEPTGLHAVFKSLWHELTYGPDAPGITGHNVRAAISAKPTVAWPDHDTFSNAILVGNLYARRVSKYALQELEAVTHGESPSDDFHIEHIAPQTANDVWAASMGDAYASLVNTWANLLPLTGRMNSSAGQADYSSKRGEYASSIFATTRSHQQMYSSWTPEDVAHRAEAIRSWALTRWPFFRGTEAP